MIVGGPTVPVPGVMVVPAAVAALFPPLWVAAYAAPPAAAAAATTMITIALAERPAATPPAPAAAPMAIAWLMVAVAVKPLEVAVTAIWNCPCTLFRWIPRADARPWVLVITVRLWEPSAKVPP